MTTKPSQRVEQDEPRARMRAVGMSHDEIAVEFARRYKLRPRGDTALVQSYAQTASSMPGADRSPWSDVLITLDVATTLTTGDDPDPEHSAALGVQALTRAGNQPIESIRQRGRALARRTAPWRSLPAVAELAEVSQTLTRSGTR